MSLSQSVQAQQTDKYLDNVRNVGVELRQLLANVDHLMPAFPSSSHREVGRGCVANASRIIINPGNEEEASFSLFILSQAAAAAVAAISFLE